MIDYRSVWDRLGIALSALCLVHCIGVPLLMLIASGSMLAFSAGAGEGWFHQWLVWAIAPVALIAVLPGWRRHRKHNVVAGMLCGLALISGAAFAGDELISPQAEMMLTLCGGALLIAAHWINLRLCRSCPVCWQDVGRGT